MRIAFHRNQSDDIWRRVGARMRCTAKKGQETPGFPREDLRAKRTKQLKDLDAAPKPQRIADDIKEKKKKTQEYIW